MSCSGCLTGYVDVGGTCVPLVSCATLSCGANRLCSDVPNGHCLDACASGFVWDAASSSCRAPKSCANLGTCASGTHCIEATSTTDAYCAANFCADGTGRDAASNSCLACSSGLSHATCTGTGYTGERVRDPSTGFCLCESQTGYFIDLSSPYPAVPCDADSDGWVTARAVGALSNQTQSSNPLFFTNARCSLRRVVTMQLVNDQGDQPHGIDLSGLPNGSLPLFETAVNDGDPATSDPLRTTYPPAIRNSLTKICIAAPGDANGNGLADVHEGGGIGASGFPNGSEAKGYFDLYTRFSYYMELDDGYYVAGAAGAPGTYRIIERTRSLQAAGPTKFPIELGTSAIPYSGYWSSCRRQTDSDDSPGTAPLHGNADLVEFTPAPGTMVSGSRWTGMNHISQFKCVEVVQQTTYDSTGNPSGNGAASREANPEVLWWNGTSLGRTNRTPPPAVQETLSNWNPWACAPMTSQPSTYAAPTSPNPSFQGFDCGPVSAASLLTNGVQKWTGWMAVGYSNAQSAVYTSMVTNYVRGCINECVVDGPTHCPGWNVGGNTSLTCDMTAATGWGHIACTTGCGAGSSLGGAGLPTPSSLHMCGQMVGTYFGNTSSGPYSEVPGGPRLTGWVDIAGPGPVVGSSDGSARLCSGPCQDPLTHLRLRPSAGAVLGAGAVP